MEMSKRKSTTISKKKKRQKPDFPFKVGDCIKHDTSTMMIIYVQPHKFIRCRDFNRVLTTTHYNYDLKYDSGKWFINGNVQIKPLSLDEIHPWRNRLAPGDMVLFHYESKTYKSFIIEREGMHVTIQPIGCSFTMKRHIHAQSIIRYLNHHDKYKIMHTFQMSEYVGARCRHRSNQYMVTVRDFDATNRLFLLQKDIRYPSPLNLSTYDYYWVTTERFLTKYEPEVLIPRPVDANKVIGQVTLNTKDPVMAAHHHKSGDNDLVIREAMAIPNYVHDFMYHPSCMYQYPCFDIISLMTHCRSMEHLNIVLNTIRQQKINICVAEKIPVTDILDANSFINQGNVFGCYLKGLKLNQKMYRHRLITLQCNKIENKKITFDILFHGCASQLISNSYKNKSNAYILNRMMIHFLNKPIRHARRNYYEMILDRSFSLPLMEYQKIAVSHMLYRETYEPSYLSHAFENNVNGMKYNLIKGVHNHMIMNKTGGILQMDVGLGKTVCTLSLYKNKPVKTVVVVPLTLIDQWKSEINKFLPLCNVSEYYGKKKDDTGDIVLTTYGTIRSMYQSHITLSSFERVIFDESHSIKSLSSTCRACAGIIAPFRWCLTATPITGTNINNIVPQLCMLNCEPYRFTSLNRLTGYVCDEIESYVHDVITSGIIIKYERCWLKPRGLEYNEVTVVEKVKQCPMNPLELMFFEHLFEKSKKRVEMSNSKSFIFLRTLVNRLFLCSILPKKILIHFYSDFVDSESVSTNTIDQIVNRIGCSAFDNAVKDTLKDLDNQSCCICMDTIERPTITKCLHIYCHDCIHQQLQHRNKCPMCRQTIDKSSLIEISDSKEDSVKEEGDIIHFIDYIGRKCTIDKMIYQRYKEETEIESSKIKGVHEIVEESGNESIVIFSQFKHVLERLKHKYPSAAMITGATSRSNRKKSIERFQNKECKIFLLSIHCASVGVTLTSGSHMIFMEPVLDPSVREQAIGRINRTGQTNNIFIHTLMNDKIDKYMVDAYERAGERVYSGSNKKNFFREEALNYFLP